jgi:DNA-directed RNA polymerase subunit beta'
MALELFKPFLMKKLVDKGVVFNVTRAKKLVESESPEVFAILDEVVKEHPVMLNRAPTLHRLGIQAFEPVLVEGKALKLHPLACKAFNADFDGDQMAIHVPLTQAAQMECWTLMLSARNLLDPANGKTIVAPSQDMVLGIYYMTAIKTTEADAENKDKKLKRFSSPDEVRMAAETGAIGWQELIQVPAPKDSFDSKSLKVKGDEGFVQGTQDFKKGDIIETSAGRLAFNEAMPEEIDYVNRQMFDKSLKNMIEHVYRTKGPWITIKMHDAIKDVGYKNATFYGATLCMDDIRVPNVKKEMVEKANKEVEDIISQASKGIITTDERYNRVCSIWARTNDQLTKIMMDELEQHKRGFNTIYMMAKSGARGSRGQISQLAAMRGLMTKPNGEIIELPIKANFKEGLSVIEYFISTNAARKGLSDTALKTADAGYMTRRLVDVAQDVVINEEDCCTINGIDYTAIKEGDEIKVPLSKRIEGHYTIERVVNAKGELICDVNQYIDEAMAKKIEAAGVEKVKLRTVLTCEAKHGICVKCYGKNLARNKIVEIGEAVGIIAAQSIGQPGTQLTLRTFHSGGAAEMSTNDNKIVLKFDAFIKNIEGTHVEKKDKWLFTRKGFMTVIRILDKVKFAADDELLIEDGKSLMRGDVILKHKGKDVVAGVNGKVVKGDGVIYITSKEQKIEITNGSTIFTKAGAMVKKGEVIGEFEQFIEPILAESDGYIHFEDVIVGSTLEEKVDLQTGKTERYITDLHLDVKQPRIIITDEAGNPQGNYFLPAGAILLVDDKAPVKAGDMIAKMNKEAQKSQDITGGLPRVSELFEARKPKNPCVLAQISGTVEFKDVRKGKRVISITDEYGKKFEHLVPMTKRMLVRDGDKVEAGEMLCAGSPNPQDVLAILGENALQNYLMDEIQNVYRQQGVDINDKHIGIIVRQMLRKIEIVSVGDTKFIFGQQVDKYKFHEENERVIAAGGQPAVGRPMFQGITKASLGVDSFISAASFQETTRVLTNAAISGATDGLHGIKENVAIGHMIPAGTGIKNYKDIKLFDDSDRDLDAQMNEILERRKLEAEMESQLEEPSFEADDND